MNMKNFRLNYPDVYFLMVGKSKGSYNDILLDISKDFFTNNVLEQEDFATVVSKRVLESKRRECPSVFGSSQASVPLWLVPLCDWFLVFGPFTVIGSCLWFLCSDRFLVFGSSAKDPSAFGS
ncbi:hypothetical protein C7M84_016166 [Penaeus vannamei]|uniref:Uncharacterized protein n=1 Tax=Penaeus vannamei TaxID=6689 RepID=A0A3R7QFI6_PENVA|nr:hypothetical protein C7M84_016166 [Penaeus vannamei]